MRPDIIVECVGGLHLFSGETDKGRQWLESRAATDRHQPIDAAVADGLGSRGGVKVWSKR